LSWRKLATHTGFVPRIVILHRVNGQLRTSHVSVRGDLPLLPLYLLNRPDTLHFSQFSYFMIFYYCLVQSRKSLCIVTPYLYVWFTNESLERIAVFRIVILRIWVNETQLNYRGHYCSVFSYNML
jgi:hypothetical protein